MGYHQYLNCTPTRRTWFLNTFQDSAQSDSEESGFFFVCLFVCFVFLVWLYLEIGEGSGTLAWKIPWTEEPGGLQSMRSLRVGHD